jgi:hypothetical protein
MKSFSLFLLISSILNYAYVFIIFLNTFHTTKNQYEEEDPRWWLEGGSRQHELCESNILLRHWSHTWQEKTTKKKQNSDTSSSQPIQSFATLSYTKKNEGLLRR